MMMCFQNLYKQKNILCVCFNSLLIIIYILLLYLSTLKYLIINLHICTNKKDNVLFEVHCNTFDDES